MSRRRVPPSSSGPAWWLIIALALVVAGVFYWWQRDFAIDWLPGRVPVQQADAPYDGPAPGAPADAPEATASVERPGDPRVDDSKPKYPLPERVPAPGEPPLPQPAESDLPILEALAGLGSRQQLAMFGNLGDLTRRFVVTVDNLPREMVPAQHSAVQRIPGALAVAEQDGRTVLKPENSERYTQFVDFVETLGAERMVSIYLRFYPLLQEEYRAIGFPNGHFNDRVIEAIDDMLAAPEPKGPIAVVQPRVHFRFADPALERLSAGQKIMIRIGPENAARLKKVLREIRGELAN